MAPSSGERLIATRRSATDPYPAGRRRLRCRAAVALACLLTAGCMTQVTPDGRRLRVDSDEFRDYAQEVFRRHNHALSELMRIQPVAGDESGRLTQIENAEAEMLRQCEKLNQLAVAARDQRSDGPARTVELARSVASCDRSTRSVETLLDEISP